MDENPLKPVGAKVMVWTAPMLARFKVAYAKAGEQRREVFAFEDHLFDIGYAKYLIEFLETRFTPEPRKENAE